MEIKFETIKDVHGDIMDIPFAYDELFDRWTVEIDELVDEAGVCSLGRMELRQLIEHLERFEDAKAGELPQIIIT